MTDADGRGMNEPPGILEQTEMYEPPAPSERDLADLSRNDIGNNERLRARHGRDLIHVDEAGWHVWSGKRWEMDGGEAEARIRAQMTADAIADEAKALDNDPPDTSDMNEKQAAETRAEYDKRVEAHYKFGTASGNAPKIGAMLTEAAPHLRCPGADMDRDLMLLNVANGTLDLDSLDAGLRPHDRADRITRVAPVAFDPDVDCPRFRKFLDRILLDKEVQVFVQTFFGYALTGDTGEQKMAAFHGAGANGKSTLQNIVAAVMGSYAMATPIDSFLHNSRGKRGGDATPDLARLPGARLVIASEPEIGARLSEATVKSITGGDTMTVRRLQKEFFEFRPNFKMVFSCNIKPSIRGQDEGIWRRLMLVPFDEQIPPGERVKNLADQLFEAEAAGILNWLLDGVRLWKERGLEPPAAVAAATDEYRSDSDPIREFMQTMTEPSPGSRVAARTLFDAYCDWCAAAAIEPATRTRFGLRLGDLGYRKVTPKIVQYTDIKLKPWEDDATENAD